MSQFQHTPLGLQSDGGGKDLGIFLPVINGGWIISKNKPEIDGSWALNLECSKLAEHYDFDFLLTQCKYRGYGGETEHWNYSLDPIVTTAALAAVTSKLKVITTMHTIVHNPGVSAKMMATLQQVAGGRAGLNIVTGSYKGEFAQMGNWPEGVGHDARYDLAYEWIRGVKALWSEDSVTMKGEYFQLEDCQSWPKPDTRPMLVCAGTSEVGMRFTAQEADAIFLFGTNATDLAKNCGRARDIAAEYGRAVRTYAMMTVVFGETDGEAEATAKHYAEGLDEEAMWGMMRAYGMLDSEIGKENDFVRKARSSFMTGHIVGSPTTILDKLSEIFAKSGIDGLMLIFPDFVRDIPVFGEQVLPALRERFPGRVASTAAH